MRRDARCGRVGSGGGATRDEGARERARGTKARECDGGRLRDANGGARGGGSRGRRREGVDKRDDDG